MDLSYVAFGLQLRTGFRLPGMTPMHRAGLPSLELSLIAEDELRAAWSGAERPPVWRGELGSGVPLTIDDGVAGDVLFTYGDRASFHLSASGSSLVCAPTGTGGDWQRALIAKVLPSVSVMLGYEALHASALRCPHGALAILASSGAGKTTLATELVLRGWPLMTDDVLVLGRRAGDVLAHPGSPHLNATEDLARRLCRRGVASSLAVIDGEHWMAADGIVAHPAPLKLLCLLRRGPQLSLDVDVLPSTPLPFVPYMLGLPGDVARERSRFSLYADLAGSATILQVDCGVADGPAQVADAIVELVGDRYPPLLAVGGPA
jgi:hypothetical protein